MTDNKHITRKIWILAISFAVLISIPFLIPHCGFISLFAFLPLFQMEGLIANNKIKHSFLYFYATFLLFNIFTTFWIWNVSAAGAVAAILLNSLQMAVIFAIFSFIKKRLSLKWIAYIAFIIIWIAWEHCYFNIELSWPWLVLGNAFATSPYLVQWYEITGSLGGSLWILATGVLLYFFVKNRKIHTAFAAVLLICIPAILSIIRYCSYKESTEQAEVMAIQPNIDPFMKYGYIPQEDIDSRFIELVENNITPETKYIITPETFTYDFDLDYPQNNASFRKYSTMMKNHPDATLLLGSMTQKIYYSKYKPTKSARRSNIYWYDLFNTALTIDHSGVLDYYHKSKLVPGVEIIPYQNTLKFLGKIVEKFGGSSSSYGTMEEMKALSCSDSSSVGALICYESVYGDFARVAAQKGAQFIAVITNDGWWGDTPGYRQHFRFAKLRAIEMRRDVVQVANTGISGFIDQKGGVKSSTGWWEETVLVDNINLNDTQTFFTKHGDILGKAACWLMIPVAGLIIVSIARRKKH